MATWKKVYVEGDNIPVTDGGTGLDTLPDGEVLIGNATGNIDSIELTSAQLLVGVGAVDSGSNPAAQTVGGDLAMDASGDFTIQPDVVTGGSGGMLADDTTLWTYNESSISGLTDATPRLPFYKPNAPSAATQVNADTVTPPTTTGDTLQYNSSSNTLVWATSSASSLAIEDQSTTDDEYHIAFVDLDAGTDVFNVDSTTLTYNPSTNLLTNGFVTLDGDVAHVAGTPGSGTSGSLAATTGGTITASNFVGLASEARKVDVHTVLNVGNTHSIPFYEGNAVGFQPLMAEGDNTFAYTPNTGLLNVTSITASDTINTTDLTVTNTISGDIDGNAATADYATTAGTATSATNAIGVSITSTPSSNTEHYLTFVTDSTTATGASLRVDATDLIFIPEDATAGIAGGTLKVPNLTVTGTTTTLQTTNLEVTDKTIKLADANDTSANAVGSGIIVDINNASLANLPSILYAGQDNSASGWEISRANHVTAGSAAITTGIGTMEIDSTITDSNYTDGNSGAIDFGVGAFCYSSNGNGGLYIQIGA